LFLGVKTMKYLLKNGTVVTGEKSEQLDILVEGEKIVQVGKNLPSKDAQEIDVSGKLLFPGFIDGHTHFDLEVAGTVTADDFETGTKAAILGGTTFVIDYASQDIIDSAVAVLQNAIDTALQKADLSELESLVNEATSIQQNDYTVNSFMEYQNSINDAKSAFNDKDEVVTNGGRVLNICALGCSLEETREKVYKAAEVIQFDGQYYRKDIGLN